MINTRALRKITCIITTLLSICILLTTTSALAAEVSLAWDNNSSSVDGYRVFARQSNQSYNYSRPVWEGRSSSCTLIGLEENTEYYFVVRAFAGNIESADSNQVHYVPSSSSTSSPPTNNGVLSSRFVESTLSGGVEYYTDRSYQVTGVPSLYSDMEMIMTPNDDRNRTDASGYLTFTMPYNGRVYVAYDSRATRLPNWMSGFTYTGQTLRTSLASQPSLRVYSRTYSRGAIVNLGANKAAGFSGGTVSNYIVFYGSGGSSGGSSGGTTTTTCRLATKFEESNVAVGTYLYTDRDYTITGGIPNWMRGRSTIQTPNNDRNNSSSSGYLSFTNPDEWWVYVLFDSRTSSIPNWLNSWELRSDIRIETSLSSQPYLKVYRKMFNAGQCVNLGGNYGPGASREVRSNYIVVYGK